jgi:general stress protein 26
MSQTKTINDPKEAVSVLAEKLKDVPFASMVTIPKDGPPVGRPMATQQIEFDGDIWFFTDENSQKVADIRSNPNVHLSYTKMEKGLWLEISGTAEIVMDKNKMKELWYDDLETYFPGGLEYPGLALVSVKPQMAEYWDAPEKRESEEQIKNETENGKLIFAH